MNPLEIRITGKESTRDILLAMVNVLNSVTREMYEGRVKQAQADIRSNQSQTNECTEFSKVAASLLTDQQAAHAKWLYPRWSDMPDGTALVCAEDATKGTEITRVRDGDDNLYKIIQTHNKHSDWAPGTATASLFTAIDVEHDGTIADPIPWNVNMECMSGKYYTYGGVLYECINSSGTALSYTPDQLLGNFFKVA